MGADPVSMSSSVPTPADLHNKLDLHGACEVNTGQRVLDMIEEGFSKYSNVKWVCVMTRAQIENNVLQHGASSTLTQTNTLLQDHTKGTPRVL